MKSTGMNTKVDSRSTARNGTDRVGICMLLGLALLVAGCWEGIAVPHARTTVLSLLSGGIAMFAAALVLLRRRTPPPPVAELNPVAPPAAP